MPWKINISSDNILARLDLSKIEPSDQIGYDGILSALQDKNVQVNSEVENCIRLVVDESGISSGNGHMPILAQGTPPCHGENGRFEWTEKFDTEKRKALRDTRTDRTNYYEWSSVIIVGKGDILGLLHPPTEGEAGTDVFGGTIKPQAGTPYKMEAGQNVKLLADGQTFIAQCDGEPKRKGKNLSIDPTITIHSDIDFSTGNIIYSGDVCIEGDIKDLFELDIKGNIDVTGTIEAAYIKCGGNLTVKEGIFGKEKGFISVQKDLSAKYLSNVTVWVKGDVSICSEIVNTDLNCCGKVLLEKGGVHGGRVTAAGNIEAPEIGSPAGVRTIVRAAVDPVLEKQMNELENDQAKLTETLNELIPYLKAMWEASGGKANEKLKKTAQEIKDCQEKLLHINQEQQKITEAMAQTCTGKIIVHKVIYPGVILYVGDVMHIIDHEVTGPLVVSVRDNNAQGKIMTFKSPD